MPNYWVRDSGKKGWKSDVRCAMANVGCGMCNGGCEMWDVGCAMEDVGRKMQNTKGLKNLR
jgi:hypothetical protein